MRGLMYMLLLPLVLVYFFLFFSVSTVSFSNLPHRRRSLTLIIEWKGRKDGLVAHVFFQGSPNFALSVFAFAVEGWIFYSAVTSVIPQVTLYLGFETSALIISVRGLAYNATAALCSMAIT